jgi:hypothetical protein
MIIAKRILRIMGDDADVEVPIAIHLPVEDDRSWRCDYEIAWPRKPRIFRAYGVDGVQALQLAMLAIGTELWANPYHHAGLLIFRDDEPGYGFPAELPREVGREDVHRAD